MIRILLGAIFALATFSTAAWANNPPAPQSMLAEIAILPVMVILTMIGGGYAILRRREKKLTSAGCALVGLAVIAIVISAVNEGLPVLIGGLFTLVAIRRGGWMIFWGLKARKSTDGDERFIDASPARLISSGGALVFTTIFLYGMVLALTFTFFMPGFSHNKEEVLVGLVAWRMAYIQETAVSPDLGDREDPMNPQEYEKIVRRLAIGGYQFIDASDEDPRDFLFFLTPSRVPFFPYNYVVSFRSYRADQTGKIRMTHVHRAGDRCPADAPVVLEVRPADIEKAAKMMR